MIIIKVHQIYNLLILHTTDLDVGKISEQIQIPIKEVHVQINEPDSDLLSSKVQDNGKYPHEDFELIAPSTRTIDDIDDLKCSSTTKMNVEVHPPISTATTHSLSELPVQGRISIADSLSSVDDNYDEAGIVYQFKSLLPIDLESSPVRNFYQRPNSTSWDITFR